MDNKNEAPDPKLAALNVRAAMIATGVSERQVYRWKSGENSPHPSALTILREKGLL